jgi:MFS family permease
MPDSPQASKGGIVLIVALLVDSLGNGLFLPLSLIFFTELTDVRLALLGVLISVANAFTLPIPIWAGSLADRYGALPLVIGAQLLQGVGYLSYNWVEGPIGIFLASALIAIGVRFFWSTVFTAVSDFADGSPWTVSKDTWFAWTSMARTAGIGVGGLVAGLAIADGRTSAYHLIAYSTAGCFFVAAASLWLFVRIPVRAGTGAGTEQETDSAGYRQVLRDRPFLIFIAINTVFAMTSMMLALGLPTFLLEGLAAPRWLSSVILVANTIVLAVFAAPVVKRLAHYRRTRTITVAAGLWALWCLLFALLMPGHLSLMLPLLVGAVALFTLGELLHAPVSMALASAMAPTQTRGRYLAVFQYSFTFAGLISPVFFTSLFEIHRSLPWIVLGAVNVIALFATRSLERVVAPAALRDLPATAPTG